MPEIGDTAYSDAFGNDEDFDEDEEDEEEDLEQLVSTGILMPKRKQPARKKVRVTINSIWTTKGGKKVKIRDMEYEHLVNSILKIERGMKVAEKKGKPASSAWRAGYLTTLKRERDRRRKLKASIQAEKWIGSDDYRWQERFEERE